MFLDRQSLSKMDLTSVKMNHTSVKMDVHNLLERQLYLEQAHHCHIKT